MMKVVSVNVGQIRTLEIKGRQVESAIYKEPVVGPCAVGPLGLVGDCLVEKRTFGVLDHAVYAYPIEHYSYWETRLKSAPFALGQFGENLTIRGALEGNVRVGDVLRFGTAVLQVGHPRLPCRKLNARMGLRFATTFLLSGRLGYYLRVIQPGAVEAGDSIEVLESDPGSPTMEKFIRISQQDYWDTQGLEHLLRSKDLAPGWRELLEDKLARARSADGWFGWRELEVFRRDIEVADVVSLYLRCPEGRPLAPFRSGQHLTFASRPAEGDRQVRRSYAISSSPFEKDYYRITVKHLIAEKSGTPDGFVSTFLSNGIAAGDRLRVAAPRGKFSLERAEEHCPSVLIICRDIGIAPVISMLQEWSERARKQPVHLVHYSRNSGCHIFKSEVEAIRERSPSLTSCFVYSESGADEAVNDDECRYGDLSDEELQRFLPHAQGRIFLAGGTKFVDAIHKRLLGLGAQAEQFVLERFGL